VNSLNYIVQKPGAASKTYSLDGLRAAIASGEVQLDWQVRRNGEPNDRAIAKLKARRA
jgi:hypothetical protein